MHNNIMNKLTKDKRVQIIKALVEGNSLRATARMCDVAFNTVLKLLPEIGKACADYQDVAFRNLRRFTRLTNAFSKKIENHSCAIALHYMHYNFCRIHKSLRVTPAMEAGVTDHVWSVEEIAGLLEAVEKSAAA